MTRPTVMFALATLCCCSVHAEPHAEPASAREEAALPSRMTREEVADLRAGINASSTVEAKCDAARASISDDVRRVVDLIKKYGLHVDKEGNFAEGIDMNRSSPTYGAIKRPASTPSKPSADPAKPTPPKVK